MLEEKEKTAKELAYELAISNEKQKQIAIVGMVFMNHLCVEGSSILFSENELKDFHNSYHYAIKGIQQFVE